MEHKTHTRTAIPAGVVGGLSIIVFSSCDFGLKQWLLAQPNRAPWPTEPLLNMKRKSPECCSAARPASLVAYIDCPRHCWYRSPTLVSQAIQNAVEVGATIINVTVDRGTDAKALFGNVSTVLEAAWGEEVSSVSVGAVMSFYAGVHWDLLDKQEIDPECACPALMLTLRERQSLGLQMSVVTVSLPSFPTRVRDRLLHAYVDKAIQSKSHTVLIGGVFDNISAPLLWLENRVSKLAFDIAMSSNENLCVLPWCTTGSITCITLDATGPYALVIGHEPSSAEPPAASTPTNASGGSNSSERNSAEQPAASTGTRTSRVSLESRGPGIILNVATPLYDKLLLDLEQTEESSTLIHHIEQHCFFGELRSAFSAPSDLELLGYRAPGAMSFSSKMESLLQISLERRRTIAEAAGLTDEQLLQHRATPSEMREMYNSWRSDVRVWMSTDDRERYFDLLDAGRNQKARQLGKHCFNAYCFHVSGCRFLLGKLIELPIISTASRHTATVMSELLQDLEDHKKTVEYKNEVQRSDDRFREQTRLSRAIWWARSELEKGRLLSTKVLEGKLAWSNIGTRERQLVEDFQTRKLKKALIELEARKASKSPAYKGTHVEALPFCEY